MAEIINVKPELDVNAKSLLVLLGIRFFFNLVFAISFGDTFTLIFAMAYAVALVGVYNRDGYGPLIALIIGGFDLLLALLFLVPIEIIIDVFIVRFAYKDYKFIQQYQNNLYNKLIQQQNSNLEQ